MERQAKEMVKKVLKAPTTAEFDYKTFRYFKLNGIGTIIGTVDSQNSFGAMIRSIWLQWQYETNSYEFWGQWNILILIDWFYPIAYIFLIL